MLEALPEIAEAKDEKKNTFLLLCNSTTHEPTLLEEPAYTISPIIDNRVYDREHTDRFSFDGQILQVKTLRQMQHYQINMAAMLQLGNWFDNLRKAECYDNCRIILVADHGEDLNQIDSMRFGEDITEDAMLYNPLLMMKDFNQHGFTVNEELMTNADTPMLAMRELITDPINPFTGNVINDQAKDSDELVVFANYDASISGDRTTYSEYDWYGVHGDVREGNNWRFLGTW